MPVLALPVFWLLPPSQSIPVYATIFLLSVFLFWLIIRSMRKKPVTGTEGLRGAGAEVVSRLEQVKNTQYMVRVDGELWRADSSDELQPGEMVIISAVNGLKLTIERDKDEFTASTWTGRGIHEWHCN